MSIRAFIKIIMTTLISLVVIPIAFFMRNRSKYQDIWIISERKREARDNGYWLFKYIMDNRLHDNTWYVIKSESPDMDRLSNYSDRLIKHYSLRHHLYFNLCSKAIFTQLTFSAPIGVMAKRFKNIMPVKKDYIYLGHGVLKDDMDFLYKKNTGIDLCITDSKSEAEGLVKAAGYGINEVIVTGRPRNDGLHDFTVRKEILLMPTHRIWFPYCPTHKEESSFRESAFYIEYQGLLDDRDLYKFLDTEGYRLLFFLHSNSHMYLHNFSTDCKNIELVQKKDMGVQEALKRAALLITDYSSVAFDSAYMGKPVIYYQFDYKKFREKQYKEGWFKYKRDGVGRIVETRGELLKEMQNIADRNFIAKKIFQKRTDRIYKYNDTGNSRRVYESIVNRKM